jgi:hypothetical protein
VNVGYYILKNISFRRKALKVRTNRFMAMKSLSTLLRSAVLQLVQRLLRAGQPRGQCSSPGGVKNFFHFSIDSRSALGGKATGA